jgi:hypothetical protein
MILDWQLLNTYKTLLETTQLQQSYQEFIRFFRCLRDELKSQLPDYKFQGQITENAMDYSYFSFTHPRLQINGLKIVVVFVHASFQLEVWICGYNRKLQCHWAEQLDVSLPFICSDDPSHTDYIMRIPVETDICAGDTAVLAVKKTVDRCIAFLEPYVADSLKL